MINLVDNLEKLTYTHLDFLFYDKSQLAFQDV